MTEVPQYQMGSRLRHNMWGRKWAHGKCCKAFEASARAHSATGPVEPYALIISCDAAPAGCALPLE